jgi:8-oxo-dGTP pyrophosphatase MutT (NUDIX family)
LWMARVAPMEPATPRSAASLILLRRGGRHRQRGVEVLLVRRSPEASFMPGVWVFPGGTVEAREGEDEAAHRACAVRELEEEAGIELPEDAELLPWSRWITPELVTVRFDTRFYVALAPPHSPPRPDGSETTDAAWMSPNEALERHLAGELSLVFPTIKHLESLLPYGSAEEVVAAARDREIEPVLPRVVGEGRERRVVLPGEPGY